jgi:hypothetical protein
MGLRLAERLAQNTQRLNPQRRVVFNSKGFWCSSRARQVLTAIGSLQQEALNACAALATRAHARQYRDKPAGAAF